MMSVQADEHICRFPTGKQLIAGIFKRSSAIKNNANHHRGEQKAFAGCWGMGGM